jgi:signal transduction histidine kinase/CheY-like chemotaxis protein
MNSSEIKRIDKITETIFHLTKGKIPDHISTANGPGPDDEISQLSGMTNKLICMFKEIKETVTPLSQGNLDVDISTQNLLASPFKQLKSSLQHLTWQTQQIAAGDYKQRVDFMGSFSTAFNSMVSSLDESRNQLLLEVERNRNFAEAQRKYLNIMAHDIRTPLGAVIGFSEILLSNKSLDNDTMENIQVIQRNCNSLMVLIDNMLEQAKLENRSIEINSIPLSIKDLLNDIEIMIQAKLNSNVAYKTILDSTIPSELLGDPHRLRQALTNLIGNAAKFTKNGFITTEVSLKEAKDKYYNLFFTVTDSGIGISKDKISTIFSAFTQADISISANFGGTGLGLSIAKELVALMKGKLEVSSIPGKGTSFFFTIPLLKYIPRTEEKTVTATAYSPNTKILYVDDQLDNLEIFKKNLSSIGICIELCSDSRKAYEILKAAEKLKKPFTLACLDLQMPFSGVEVAKQIRKDPLLQNLIIAAVSSFPKKSYQNSHLFNFIIKKPVTQAIAKKLAREASLAAPIEKNSAGILNGIRILLVDDCRVNHVLISKMLEKYNVHFSEAYNGITGVKLALSQKFDIVLMDYLMPEMNGLEAIREIRKAINRKTLPIFAFTANDSKEATADFIEAGANTVISKPIKIDQLIYKLQAICKEKK